MKQIHIRCADPVFIHVVFRPECNPPPHAGGLEAGPSKFPRMSCCNSGRVRIAPSTAEIQLVGFRQLRALFGRIAVDWRGQLATSP